jgi:hypothetical protein
MEIPEGNQIATDEIIDMEGQLEVKRVEEEMRIAATAAMQVKEAKMKENQIIEMKRRERGKLHSIVKIQTQGRCYIARGILREKCYKYYIKHFDTKLKAYYYENTKTHKTSWDKPAFLGSYDIDPKDQWVCLKDNNDDTYYYNPLTWAMQWTPPENTVFCSVCGYEQFAVARLNIDKLFYCEIHFNEQVQMMLEKLQFAPRAISFKEFDGCVRGSDRIDFSLLHEETWHSYLLKHKLNLKLDSDDLDEDDEEEKKDLPHEDIMCTRCNVELADGYCEICCAHFCQACFTKKHKAAVWANHQFRIIDKLVVHTENVVE